MKAFMFHGGRCWVSDPDHPNYVAGRNATKMVYGVDPDLTREGGSIPVTISLEEATGKNVILLPMGACDDGAHSQNEKITSRTTSREPSFSELTSTSSPSSKLTKSP